MQALVPWTRHKEHVALLSACGLWDAVMLAAKPAGEQSASLTALKAQHGMFRPGSSMHGVLQTMAINLIRCAAETAAMPWPLPCHTSAWKQCTCPPITQCGANSHVLGTNSPDHLQADAGGGHRTHDKDSARGLNSKERAAMGGSLCLQPEAVAFLCTLARQRPKLAMPHALGLTLQTPSAIRPSSPATSQATSSQQNTSPPQSPQTVAYKYLRAVRNHMSTRAAICLCAVMALAHADGELDQHLKAGGGEELLYQLWRLREWEEARDEWGARSEVEELDGKRLLMVALANVALNSLHRNRGSTKAP